MPCQPFCRHLFPADADQVLGAGPDTAAAEHACVRMAAGIPALAAMKASVTGTHELWFVRQSFRVVAPHAP